MTNYDRGMCNTFRPQRNNSMKPIRQHKPLPHQPSVYRCGSKTDQKGHYFDRLASHVGYLDIIFANWFRKAAEKSEVDAPTAKRHLVLRRL